MSQLKKLGEGRSEDTGWHSWEQRHYKDGGVQGWWSGEGSAEVNIVEITCDIGPLPRVNNEEVRQQLNVVRHKVVSRLAPFGLQVLVSAAAYGTGLGVFQVVGAALRVSCAPTVVGSHMGLPNLFLDPSIFYYYTDTPLVPLAPLMQLLVGAALRVSCAPTVVGSHVELPNLFLDPSIFYCYTDTPLVPLAPLMQLVGAALRVSYATPVLGPLMLVGAALRVSCATPVLGPLMLVGAALRVSCATPVLGPLMLVGAALRVSCATPVLGPLMGLASVGTSAAFAGHLTRHVDRQIRCGKGAVQALATPFWLEKIEVEEILFDAFIGVTAFKMWSGHFRRLMPSDLRKPGAFAYQSVPLGKSDYANSVQKGQLVAIFKRDGCHSCGRSAISRSAKVVGDHIPPTKLALANKAADAAASESERQMKMLMQQFSSWLGAHTAGAKQRYFAQCAKCSSKQGAKIAHAKFGTNFIVLHRFWKLKPWSFPGVLVGMRQLPYILPPASGDRRVHRTRNEQPTGNKWRGIWGWIRPLEQEEASKDIVGSTQESGSVPVWRNAAFDNKAGAPDALATVTPMLSFQ
eukprot:gene5557-4193_t